MNCKQGDLAVVVCSKTHPHIIGAIVRCVQHIVGHKGMDGWIVDRHFNTDFLKDGALYLSNGIADKCLRPIRDSDKDDETLAWAGKPNEVIV